jgi:hypothetical protein
MPTDLLGTLSCNLAPTVGFIVGTRQRLSCRYTPDGPWPPEIYVGHLSIASLSFNIDSERWSSRSGSLRQFSRPL